VSTPRPRAEAPLLDGPGLLERAVGYARVSLMLVDTADQTASTPCSGWDLRALLTHMNDSLAAFTEAAEVGYVDLVPVRTDDTAGDASGRLLVDRLQARACAVLGAWAHLEDRHPTGPAMVSVGGREIPTDLLAAAGSLEIATHGWDVAQACGADRPLPPALALELLDVLPCLVGDSDRGTRFADPVDVPLHARPSTRLLAALGRRAPR